MTAMDCSARMDLRRRAMLPRLAGRILLAAGLLMPSAGARGAVLSPGAKGCVIYRAGAYETDDKFRIAEYTRFDDFRTGTVFQTLSGEKLRLTPGHKPLIILYPSQKTADPNTIKQRIVEAKERFPHLVLDIVAIERAWDRPASPDAADTAAPAGAAPSAGGKGPPLAVAGGKIFEGWIISRVDGDRATIIHAGGVATVPVTDLPESVVKSDPRLAAAVAKPEKVEPDTASPAVGTADGATLSPAGMGGRGDAPPASGAGAGAEAAGSPAPAQPREGIASGTSGEPAPRMGTGDTVPPTVSRPDPNGEAGGAGKDAMLFGMDVDAVQGLLGPLEDVTKTELGGALVLLSDTLSRHLGVRAGAVCRVTQVPEAFGGGMVLLGFGDARVRPGLIQVVWFPSISGCGIRELAEVLGLRRRPMLAPAGPPPAAQRAAVGGFQDWDAFSSANEWRAIRLPGNFEVRLLNLRHRLVAGMSPNMCIISSVSEEAYRKIFAWNCRGAIARMDEPARALFSEVLRLYESFSGTGEIRLSHAGAAVASGRWDLLEQASVDDVIDSLERDSKALKGALKGAGDERSRQIRLAREILGRLSGDVGPVDGLGGVLQVLRSEFVREPIAAASLDHLKAAAGEALCLASGLPPN